MSSWPWELEGNEPPMEGIYLNTETDELHRLAADWPDYDPSTPYLDTEYAYIVKVACVGITDGEYGWLRKYRTADFEPFIGFDFAGWVVSAPQGARWKPGTQVYGFTSRRRAGNARTYTRVGLGELWEKPFRLSFEHAATVPMSALAAFHALFFSITGNPSDAVLVVPPHIGAFCPNSKDKPRVNGARRILVIGGAGAVGGMVVQLAALAGASLVVATCSRKNMAFVQSLGAYTVIAYDKENKQESHLARYRHYFHAVIDCVGGEALREAWLCVRRGGKIFSVVNNPLDFTPLDWSEVAHDVKSACFSIKPNRHHLQLISILIAEGILQPIFSPGNVLEFDQYNEVNDRLVSKERGKLVLRINNEEPWDVIELLDEFGTVPALPRPEVTPPRRPRGLTTEQILADYTGNRARYKKAKAKGRTGKNRKRIKNRSTGKGKEEAAAGGGDTSEESEAEEESETEGEEGQEEPVRVDEDALLPNPWEVNPREPRGEEQDESSDQPPAPEVAESSVGLGIQEPAYSRPEPVWFSRQAANEMNRKVAEDAARRLLESLEAERAAEEAARVARQAEEAERARQLEQALLDSLPANATKLDRARVRDQILRIKLYGEENAFRDQSGSSRRGGGRDGGFIGPSWFLKEEDVNGEESDKHGEDHPAYEIRIWHPQAKGKQRAGFVDYGYQVVEVSPQKQQEEDGEQDGPDDATSSSENTQIIGIKRPAEDNLEVTEKDLLDLEKLIRKKYMAGQRLSPSVTERSLAMENIPDLMEVDGNGNKVGDNGVRMQLSSSLDHAMAAGLRKGLQEGAACLGGDIAEVQRATSALASALTSSALDEPLPSMENDDVSLGLELPQLPSGQAKSPALVPSPLGRRKAMRLARLDAHADAQLLVRRNRQLFNTIGNLPGERLRKNRPPKKPKYGKLSEDVITLTLVLKPDGTLVYKNKSELERSMLAMYETDQSPMPSPQQSPPQQSSPWGSDDDRILAAALGAEIGKGKEKARRPPVPVPV